MSDPITFKAALAEFCALACAAAVFVAAALDPAPSSAAGDEMPAPSSAAEAASAG